jgi:hypothetical protein
VQSLPDMQVQNRLEFVDARGKVRSIMARSSLRPARLGWMVALAAVSSVALGHDASSRGPDVESIEARYLAENDAAMTKMMTDMAVTPTGDVDRDFVAMMVPHHQGAIDMAMAVLLYGQNEKIRRIAQEIIVTQQQEIVAMRLAVGDALVPSIASSTEHR